MKINFRNQFSSSILSRGREYANGNAVYNVRKEKDKIYAEVSGSYDNYKVEVQIKDDTLTSCKCSCPHYKSGNKCKHIAALLYYLEYGGKVAEGKTLTKEEMIEAYYQKMYRVIQSNTNFHGEIDYEHSDRFEEKMCKILDEIKDLVKSKEYLVATSVTLAILNVLVKYVFDDFEFTAVPIFDECMTILRSILDKAKNTSDEIVKVIYSFICSEIEKEVFYENSLDFRDLIDWFIENLTYYDEIIEFLEKNLVSNDISSGTVSWTIVKLFKMFEVMGDETQKKEILDKYSTNGIVLVGLARMYDNNNEFKKAMEVLEDALKNEEVEAKGEIAKYLAKLQKRHNMTNDYKETLFDIIYKYDKGDPQVFNEISENYSSSEWQAKKKEIIQKLENDCSCTKLPDLYIKEDMWDELINYLGIQPLDVIENYGYRIPYSHKSKLLELYVNQARFFANYNTGRENSNILIRILNRIKGLSQNRFDSLIKEFNLTVFLTHPELKKDLGKFLD